MIEDFTRQTKNSGWEIREAREMVVSGFVGWQRRMERRKKEGGEKYRSAGSSLQSRTRRKLKGKEEWYKERGEKIKREDLEEVDRSWKKPKRVKEQTSDIKTVAVMFVPFTKGGELAKMLREAEEELGKQTGFKIKIVESGTRLVDLLHKSDPWQGKDCHREGCLVCSTKVKTGKGMDQDCTRRSIVYETGCITCEKKEEKMILEIYEEEDQQREASKKIRLFKYIGESSRSPYERGLEHLRDLEELKKDSHMLKHFFSEHEREEIKDMEFGMRVLKTHKTAYDRQISESVTIQTKKMKHTILN